MSYFWKNGLVELKMIREEDSHNFYDVLMDTQTRKQAEHGIYLPATVQYTAKHNRLQTVQRFRLCGKCSVNPS